MVYYSSSIAPVNPLTPLGNFSGTPQYSRLRAILLNTQAQRLEAFIPDIILVCHLRQGKIFAVVRLEVERYNVHLRLLQNLRVRVPAAVIV